MNNVDLAKQFTRCTQAGDVEGALACMHPDAKIWQNYDNVEKTPEQIMGTLQLIKAKCASYLYEVHMVEEISTGYVQRHTLHLTGRSGEKASAEVVAIVAVKDEKLSYVEEFLDPTALLPLLT